MAAAVRNNVWAAPGQDAPFLRRGGAPLTVDGLRGEDQGQVLSHTRDATAGTSSYHDYHLVWNYFLIIIIMIAFIFRANLTSPRREDSSVVADCFAL